MRTCVLASVCVYVRAYVAMHVCFYVYMHVFVHMHLCVFINECKHMILYLHVYTFHFHCTSVCKICIESFIFNDPEKTEQVFRLQQTNLYYQTHSHFSRKLYNHYKKNKRVYQGFRFIEFFFSSKNDNVLFYYQKIRTCSGGFVSFVY